MDKKIIIIITVVVVIGLAVAGYFYLWPKLKGTPEKQALEKAGEAAEKITESVTQGTLPSMDIQTNPLGEAQDINPVDQANPFKNVKTNPFE